MNWRRVTLIALICLLFIGWIYYLMSRRIDMSRVPINHPAMPPTPMPVVPTR